MLLYLAQVKYCGVTKYSLCSSHNPVLAIAHHRRTPVVSRVKRSVSAMGVPHPLHTKHSGWYKRVSPADWREREGRRGGYRPHYKHFCCLCPTFTYKDLLESFPTLRTTLGVSSITQAP